MSQHTPGPLEVRFVYDAYYPRHPVTVTFNADKGFTSAQAEALARLIAAAPEMLEALRNVTGWAERMEGAFRLNERPPAGAFLNEFCNEARALLAKIEGQP